jgi:Sap-like sulfolipid-1-addressing protein
VQQYLSFCVLALVDPVLVGATAVMLLLPDPERLMRSFVLGALVTSIPVGLLIVFSLKDSAAVNTTQHTVSPALNIALGCVFLLACVALATGLWERSRERRRRRKGTSKDKAPSRLQQALDKGSPRLTFAVGAVYEALPGVYYLGALDGIVKLDPAGLAAALLVVLICILQLTCVLAPLISFAVAPDWTPKTLARGKAWFTRNGHKIAVLGTGIVGSALVAEGLIPLLG